MLHCLHIARQFLFRAYMLMLLPLVFFYCCYLYWFIAQAIVLIFFANESLKYHFFEKKCVASAVESETRTESKLNVLEIQARRLTLSISTA